MSLFPPALPDTAGEMATLTDVLSAREERYLTGRQLLAGGDSVVSFSVVAPGGIKRSPFLDQVFQLGESALRREINVLQVKTLSHLGGKSLFLTTSEEDTALKKICIALEEHHPLGRLWDIDVIAADSHPVSRQELGFPPRPCLCCAENAKVCARERRHSIVELYESMKMRFLAALVGKSMADALHQEAQLTPKPGLVDADNQGSHPDMSLSLLLRSADVLEPFLGQCFLKGGEFASTPASPEILTAIRPLGRQAEKAMLQATGGVNTHKGALFAFALLAAALGRRLAAGEVNHWALLSQDIAAIARDLPQELGQGESAGHRIFRQYGFTGARGEAASGFAILTNVALPAYQRLSSSSTSPEHAWRFVLLNLFAENQDTNVITRGGLEALDWLQQTAKQLLNNPHLLSDENALVAALITLDQHCTEKNISTGGSADLLALTIWLTRYFFHS